MLIAMAVHDTAENRRSELTEQTLDSLAAVLKNSRHHRVFFVDNGSIERTRELLNKWSYPHTVIRFEENIGTAKAINAAWRHRKPSEHAVKMDNDVVIRNPTRSPFDLMEDILYNNRHIGIVGLKRKDLAEWPLAVEPFYKSELVPMRHKPGEPWLVLEKVEHVMGTCQAYSCDLLEQMGYLYQLDGLYGFDDSIASLRAAVLGFDRMFIPHIEIDHIDPGGTAYSEWKSRYAGEHLQGFLNYKNALKSGYISPYYNGE